MSMHDISTGNTYRKRPTLLLDSFSRRRALNDRNLTTTLHKHTRFHKEQDLISHDGVDGHRLRPEASPNQWNHKTSEANTSRSMYKPRKWFRSIYHNTTVVGPEPFCQPQRKSSHTNNVPMHHRPRSTTQSKSLRSTIASSNNQNPKLLHFSVRIASNSHQSSPLYQRTGILQKFDPCCPACPSDADRFCKSSLHLQNTSNL